MKNSTIMRILEENVRLHVIPSKKFKTDLLGVYFSTSLSMENATKNALLSCLLDQGTKSYPTRQLFNRHLDTMYGSVLFSDVGKNSRQSFLHLKMQMPNKRHLSGIDILPQGISLLAQVLFSPYLKQGEFPKNVFENEKQNLIDDIEGQIDNKTTYALTRCLEQMCIGEPFASYRYGDAKFARSLSAKQLKTHFDDLIYKAPVDLIFLGDANVDFVEDLIRKTMPFPKRNLCTGIESVECIQKENVQFLDERFAIKQAKLCLGFRVERSKIKDMEDALVVLSNILGGGPSSRLFKKLREEQGLCYLIFSQAEREQGILLVIAGIDRDNKNNVLEQIKKEILILTQGLFSVADMERAKDAAITAIRTTCDAPNAYMNFFYSCLQRRRTFSVESPIENISLVKKEDVIKVAKALVLDTVYFLTAEEIPN